MGLRCFYNKKVCIVEKKEANMNVALIPVRGGSKSIPLKNIKPLCGKPLVYWVIKAACSCKFIDKVYVATDSSVISETVNGLKIGNESSLFSKMEVINRSAQTATDTASTESVMLEFAENYLFDSVVLIQATSPLLKPSDLDRGFCEFQFIEDILDKETHVACRFICNQAAMPCQREFQLFVIF